MTLLQAENLQAGYEDRPVIHDITFSLGAGEFLAVCGPNGSGKSTLIKALQKLTPFLRGRVLVNGHDLFRLNHRQLASLMASVPQVFQPVFDYSVEEIVAMARYYRQSNPFAGMSAKDREAIEEALKLTGTWPLRHKKLNQLSGGERQRVLIARALAQETPLLLLDEPSSHLDLNFQLQIYSLLKYLQKEKNKAILVAEHNLNLAAAYCSKMIFLKKGKIVAGGQTEKLLEKNLIQEVFQVEVDLRINRSTGLPEISLVHSTSRENVQSGLQEKLSGSSEEKISTAKKFKE